MKQITNKNRLLILGLFATLGLNLSLNQQTNTSIEGVELSSIIESDDYSTPLSQSSRGSGISTNRNSVKGKKISIEDETIKYKDFNNRNKKAKVRSRVVILNNDFDADNPSTAKNTIEKKDLKYLLKQIDFTSEASSEDCNLAGKECSEIKTPELVALLKDKKTTDKHKDAIKNFIKGHRVGLNTRVEGLTEGMFCEEQCFDTVRKGTTYAHILFTAVESLDEINAHLSNIKSDIKRGEENLERLKTEAKAELAEIKKCNKNLDGSEVDDRQLCYEKLMEEYVKENSKLCKDERTCKSGANKNFKKITFTGDKDEKLAKMEHLLGILGEDESYDEIVDKDHPYHSLINTLKVRHYNMAQGEDLYANIQEFLNDPYADPASKMEALKELMADDLYRASIGGGVDKSVRDRFMLGYNSNVNSYCWADALSAQSKMSTPKASFLGLSFNAGFHKYDTEYCNKVGTMMLPGTEVRHLNQIQADLRVAMNDGVTDYSLADVASNRNTIASNRARPTVTNGSLRPTSNNRRTTTNNSSVYRRNNDTYCDSTSINSSRTRRVGTNDRDRCLDSRTSSDRLRYDSRNPVALRDNTANRYRNARTGTSRTRDSRYRTTSRSNSRDQYVDPRRY